MIMKLQVMIKLFVRAACISFLYNCGTLALRGTSLPFRVTSLHSAQLLRSLANTRLQGRRIPNNCAYSRNHRLLLHTALDARETFDDNVIGPRTILSTSTDKVALVLSDFHVITRVDAVDKIRHFELYLRRRKGGVWWAFLIQFLPMFLRPKPSAKTGVRTYTSSSVMMDNLVKRCFGEDALMRKMEKKNSEDNRGDYDMKNENSSRNDNGQGNNNKRAVKSLNPSSAGTANEKWASKTDNESKALATVGLFVYMWIAPFLRKKLIGNILLTEGQNLCRDLGADHMILVHDDNGSGKLIKYYTDRGFEPIFDVIDKGMIGKL